MADVTLDSRDLAVLLDLINGLMEDYELDFPSEATYKVYERTCKLAGIAPLAFEPYEQQSLGFLEDEEPPRPGGRGVMADYIHRWRGGGGLHRHLPPPPPPPDVAKEIADKMARASKDAVQGKTPPTATPPPKRALTDEEREELRRALDGE